MSQQHPIEFALLPHKGVGPLTLGMSRDAVRNAMQATPSALPMKSQATSDEFFDSSLSAHYNGNNKVTYFRMSFPHLGGVSYRFDEVDVFATPAKKVLSRVERDAKADRDLSDEKLVVFTELGLAFYEPLTDYDYSGNRRRKVFASAELGGDAFISGLRSILQEDLYTYEWSKRTNPNKTCAKQVRELRRMNAEVALDDRGNVKRVQFVADSLTSPLRDEDLQLVSDMATLEALWLGGNADISSKCLVSLKGLRRLRALALMGTNVEDKILKGLKSWPELERLSLPNGVSALGLSSLKRATRLRELRIHLHADSEAGLSHLSDVQSLRVLRISSGLTDRGLKLLHDCKQLERLSARGSKISKKAIESLRRKIPGLTVFN